MLCDKVWGFVKRHSTVPGVVIIFAATYILMLAVHAGETGAAWIQAFGSIGAILAAAYIASQDRRETREREVRKETVICLALLIKVQDARNVVWALNLSFMHDYNANRTIAADRVKSGIAALDVHIQHLRAVDLASLPHPRLVNTLVDVIDTVEDARSIAANDLVNYIKHHGQRGPFWRHLNDAERHIEVIDGFAKP